jgi:hypothetical protein
MGSSEPSQFCDADPNKSFLLAGLDSINPHVLRNTFATRYLDGNKGNLQRLARLLGHDSLNNVMIYTEPAVEDLAKRMERVEVGGQKDSIHKSNQIYTLMPGRVALIQFSTTFAVTLVQHPFSISHLHIKTFHLWLLLHRPASPSHKK